jgi:SAM-dependent methyltransferase
MTPPPPGPDRILRMINGYWSTALIATAVDHAVFDQLAAEPLTTAELAERAGISERGAQALLDGLVALDLVHLDADRYANTPEAAEHLVGGTRHSLTRFAALKRNHMASLTELSAVVRAGQPTATPVVEVADNPHWEALVVALAAQSVPTASLSAQLLGLADAGPISILDIGGGSGVYSRTWLEANPKAVAEQVDWAPINQIARRLLAEQGLADRFTTRDGDFHKLDLGEQSYDVAVYSHIAHQESPESNVELFGRLGRALRPGGVLVVCDYVVDDDRSGPPFALTFASEMLVKSQSGGTWRRRDYQDWLRSAGFEDISFHAADPATVVLARVPGTGPLTRSSD